MQQTIIQNKTYKTMSIIIRVVFVILFANPIFGYQNSYDVVQERMEREYVDHSKLDLICGVYKSNRTTNALNVTVKVKHALTDQDLIMITGYKWLSNEYRLDIIQFQDTVRSMMNIKYFDIKRLFQNYTTPPIAWPVMTNVTYRMFNWIPESTEFPPGVPEGRWKLLINCTKADKTPIFAVSWYFKIEYKVKYFEFATRKPKRH